MSIQQYFKRYQFCCNALPEHTKECEYRITHGFRHDNCFCECHDKGKYHGKITKNVRKSYTTTTKASKDQLGNLICFSKSHNFLDKLSTIPLSSKLSFCNPENS